MALPENKTIVLTGVTGRLGGAFAAALAGRNRVFGLARYTQPGQQEFWRDAGIETVVCDLASGDFAGVPSDPDYVVHAAAAVAPASPEAGFRDNAEASGLLLHHCRGAGAFLHVSTTGIYAQHDDPAHRYCEDVDPAGGSTALGHYAGTKLAAEGAVRAMARATGVPLAICRMDMQYGTFSDGGYPVARLRSLLRGEAIRLPPKPAYHTLVSDDDLIYFIEPCLQAASVQPVTVHWGGDEAVPAREWISHLAGLVGVEPRFEVTDAAIYRSCWADNTKRFAITGPCRVPWREGLARLAEHWTPRLQE